MGEKQPSAAATRLAEVAIAEHMRCPGLDSPGWEKYGSPGDCALHRVALALDAAGVGKAVEKLEYITTGSGTHSQDPLIHAENCIEEMKAEATAALAALTGNDDAK